MEVKKCYISDIQQDKYKNVGQKSAKLKKKCSIWRTFAFINEPFCREKICFVAVGDWEFCCGEFGCGGLGEEESGWVTVELWVKYPSREKQPF